MERHCPRKERHPPNRVNFIKRLREKKGGPFAQAKSWPQLSRMLWFSRVDPAERAKVLVWRNFDPRRVKRVPQLGGSTFYLSQRFVSHSSFCFLRLARVGEWLFYPEVNTAWNKGFCYLIISKACFALFEIPTFFEAQHETFIINNVTENWFGRIVNEF